MDAPEAVADDELLYRRISVAANPQLYDPTTGSLSDKAFGPHKSSDQTGLSLFRARYKTIEEAAKGQPGRTYYVAVLKAGDLREAGIAVEPRPHVPDGYDISHVELPQLNSANYRSDETQERQRVLADLALEVKGPY